MKDIDLRILQKAAPTNKQLSLWVEPIKAACLKYGIDQPREVAAFLAQCAHESQSFTRLEENLNYSAEGLMNVWPKRFTNLAFAKRYHRRPEAIANYVYANRMGNGPETSGDGWRYRGAGLIQLTGRTNHSLYAHANKMQLINVAGYLRTREGAADSAGWFWKVNNIDIFAATLGVEDETRAINGGLHGFNDRRIRFDAVLKELL